MSREERDDDREPRPGCPDGCLCPCHTDVEDPGPTHHVMCAWADPDFGGWEDP